MRTVSMAALRKISEQHGIPLPTLVYRRRMGMVLASPVAPRTTAARQARHAARVCGEKKFIGGACTACDNTVRYTSNGGCVDCICKAATEQYEYCKEVLKS